MPSTLWVDQSEWRTVSNRVNAGNFQAPTISWANTFTSEMWRQSRKGSRREASKVIGGLWQGLLPIVIKVIKYYNGQYGWISSNHPEYQLWLWQFAGFSSSCEQFHWCCYLYSRLFLLPVLLLFLACKHPPVSSPFSLTIKEVIKPYWLHP